MEVELAYPEGYNLIPDVVELAGKQSEQSGGSFKIVDSMDEAFRGADVVYPKSWAPFEVMEQRTKLLKSEDEKALKDLESYCLNMNAQNINWECNDKLMQLANDSSALYMHCLPADISGVSCQQGEVQKEVFEKYRLQTYHEAGYKPYIIASMIMNNRFENPARLLSAFESGRYIRKY